MSGPGGILQGPRHHEEAGDDAWAEEDHPYGRRLYPDVSRQEGRDYYDETSQEDLGGHWAVPHDHQTDGNTDG